MTQHRARLVVAVLLAGLVAMVAAQLWLSHLCRAGGRADLTLPASGGALLLAITFACAATGAVVAAQQPRNPAGWLFLGLAVVIALPVDGWASYGEFVAPGRPLPGAHVAVWLADREWILWFLPMMLVLDLTPDGHFLSPRWRVVGLVGTAGGVLAYVTSIPMIEAFDPPYQHVANPFAAPSLQPAAGIFEQVGVYALGLGLILSAVSLVVRFRRSRGPERTRLLWLVVGVLPLPPCVVVAFVAPNDGVLRLIATCLFLVLIPVGAGLSVLRYRLYDVDRVLSATATYTLLSLVLIGTYALVVWVGATLGTRWGAGPELSATVGALAAAAVAAPSRRAIQTGLDRRFSRRSYEARRLVRAGLASADAGIDLEELLRTATTDPGLTVAYPDERAWVRPDGTAYAGRPDEVDVDRQGRVVARIGYDPDAVEPAVVARAARLASAELDNGRLRAELARRLTEIDASRRRLAVAQRTERRRIERDLHDGAQQRLLALALELQSARLNGDPDRMRAALAEGADTARDAVRDLRALANGLHPAALADGGLSAAIDDLARHSPVPLAVSVEPARLDPGLEFTAWLVVGEAVVNAQKHAGADRITVSVARSNGHLDLRVSDDGRGGANPDGPGLRGLRDRVETAHGTLEIRSADTGTTVEAVLPCGS